MALYVLDTDTVTLLLRGHAGVAGKASAHDPGELAVAIFTVPRDFDFTPPVNQTSRLCVFAFQIHKHRTRRQGRQRSRPLRNSRHPQPLHLGQVEAEVVD